MGALFCGVDAGASATKVVLADASGRIAGAAVRRSGVDFAQASRLALDEALGEAGAAPGQVSRTLATGYGRTNVGFSDMTATEIACHAAAVHAAYVSAATVVDIGGQDSKVIRIDGQGRRIAFRMNRKCAAGTGAFLEEIALRLDVELSRMAEAAGRATDPVNLGSFCTVFTKTEILGLIRQGRTLDDISWGVYDSVVKRIIEMDPLEGLIVMTGGVVEHNPIVARLLGLRLGREVATLARPQLAGALGAAIIAARGEAIKDEEDAYA